MITFAQAQKKIIEHVRPLPACPKPLGEALRGVLASDLRAPVSLPLFDNSAMDGFVLRSADTAGASTQHPARLKILGAIRAGDTQKRRLGRGQVFAIMTGAPIPRGADTVLEKEAAKSAQGLLNISHPVPAGRHIRFRGEEITKGTRIHLRGLEATPGVIGFLASLGLGELSVHKKPRVSLIVTGDELVSGPKPLKKGQLYDSNTPMLLAALGSMGMKPTFVQRARDEKRTLKAALSKAIQTSEVVILTGGVSVGDYDYAKEIFKELGVKTIFWKVRQKPGKPVFFGVRGRVLVFGLPGNPAGTHVCFYQYVYPALRILSGYRNVFMTRELVALEKAAKPDPEKTLFLKARIRGSGATRRCEVLGHQGSNRLSSLCHSQGFAVLAPGKKEIRRGQKVFFQTLPGEGKG